LIVASTNIFKDFSSIPFVGIPLAIGVIAGMFASFASAKVNAFKALDDVKKFRKGGLIDAPDHEHGGDKYYSKTGKGIELEGGEMVINKEKTKEFYPLLKMVNEGMGTNYLREIQETLVGGDTIHEVNNELIRESVRIVKDTEGYAKSDTVVVVTESKDTNDKLDELIALEKSKITAYEDDKYFYVVKNGQTSKHRKAA
jgi:hypothetical protein